MTSSRHPHTAGTEGDYLRVAEQLQSARIKRPVLMIVLLFLAVALPATETALSQAAPGGLPRVLSECDKNMNVAICGIWIWNGSAYDATWPTGASARITVGSASATGLVFNRVDTVGPSAELTGTYTGRWTGKTVTNSKFSWTLHGTTVDVTWTAAPAIAPVVCFRKAPAPPEITNLYPAPLTAYTFVADPNDKGDRMNTSNETYDIRLPNRADHHLHPAVVQFTSIADENCSNADAYGYPSHISMAIFADGASFGAPSAVAEIMAERNRRQRDYKETYDRVCTLGQQGKSLAEISQALDQLSTAGSQAAPSVARNFYRASRGPADVRSRIGGTLQQLKTARDGLLADPVKDEHGKLYFMDTPSTACISPEGGPF